MLAATHILVVGSAPACQGIRHLNRLGQLTEFPFEGVVNGMGRFRGSEYHVVGIQIDVEPAIYYRCKGKVG